MGRPLNPNALCLESRAFTLAPPSPIPGRERQCVQDLPEERLIHKVSVRRWVVPVNSSPTVLSDTTALQGEQLLSLLRHGPLLRNIILGKVRRGQTMQL